MVYKCEISFDMYEPYLNREKQYLKMNADLDSRFKEIDQAKNDSSDTSKPRLNVFGNSSKVNQSSAKVAIQTPKHKSIGIKCVATTKSSDEVPKNDFQHQNVSCETVNSSRVQDKTQKSKTTAASARSYRLETHVINKSLNNKDSDSSLATNKTPGASMNTSTESPSKTDTAVRKNISSDGLIKFLKSKVAILKQELELSQQENLKNMHAYETSMEALKKNAAKMEVVINDNESLKIKIEKLQKANDVYETVLKEKDEDIAGLNKEIGMLKKDLKEANRLHNSLEKRFLKSQDDLEHAKKNYNKSQECERQQREVNNRQRTFFEEQIKILSKQRTGLISAYKKQLLLLDNLKRQNLCLEQSKLIQIAENDFTKVLDWNN